MWHVTDEQDAGSTAQLVALLKAGQWEGALRLGQVLAAARPGDLHVRHLLALAEDRVGDADPALLVVGSAALAHHEQAAARLLQAGETERARQRVALMADLEHARDPGLADNFGGPFNGQPLRQAIFEAVLARVPVKAIIETGTYRGVTTRFMAERFAGPIQTVEVNPVWAVYAAHQLHDLPTVTAQCQDSRTFLVRHLIANRYGGGPVLFYLDAHWQDDLPLLDEVTIIAGYMRDALVLVDDFAVPGDPGYSSDDYGPGKRLDLPYLAPVLAQFSGVFFPVDSAREGGSRRGCVLLASSPALAAALAGIPLLRRHPAA